MRTAGNQEPGKMSGSRVIFYYDVVCPFAYMASRLVEAMAQRTGADVVWRPVLLDLRRQLARRGVPYRDPTHFPQKTVYAMRILAGVKDQRTRIALSHDLYRAHFCEDRNLGDPSCLREIASGHGVDVEALVQSTAASQQLRHNTTEVVERGGFGVPSFYVNGRLFWGTDRMFFVERALGMRGVAPERLTTPPSSGGAAKLSFYFDYSSPWAYVGFMRLGSLVESVAPVQVNIEYVSILLGALFKETGTPSVPLTTMSTQKQTYYQQDMEDWCDFAGVDLNFPDVFPIRSVLPLRATLASQCDPAIIQTLYLAAWRDNKNIGDSDVCHRVLQEAGFDADRLLCDASSEPVKKQLFANTSRAVSDGVCGTPSYQVNNRNMVIWGQDKQSTVEDLLCGWSDISTAAKL
ncbi:2-hydroxychromene-2-carboxylate isomerase [Geodia barretti]|uniref:2-hydroxychromene-2-carboxylate isomerase n=1 Tax=Geodia barretti TaxID=519541 RepID=A0AA35TQW1_GEOBA|nr:2-hydroxychromene-2-carboxylate isomerase [Geodia barretti]